MRAVIQRVQTASVAVKGDQIGTCDAGMLILICAMAEDTPEHAEKLASKITKLRIFADAEGRMNKSLLDIGGSALVISQFTLAADTKRGNRPGFSRAAPPELRRLHNGLGFWLFGSLIIRLVAQSFQRTQSV